MSDQVKIVVGCNYHTKWQSKRAMRFVLDAVQGDRALLSTRITGKQFWTNVSDLIFIDTGYNHAKAKRLSKQESTDEN